MRSSSALLSADIGALFLARFLLVDAAPLFVCFASAGRASTDGAPTDGAPTDGASTDGASTDGASTLAPKE